MLWACANCFGTGLQYSDTAAGLQSRKAKALAMLALALGTAMSLLYHNCSLLWIFKMFAGSFPVWHLQQVLQDTFLEKYLFYYAVC